jgi:hypothetical protein
VAAYRRKLCWDSKTTKTRIVVSIEVKPDRFVVHRKGKKTDWTTGLTTVSPIADICIWPSSLAEFSTEQAAIVFADDITNRLIEHQHFTEHPDAPDEEYPY